MITVNKMSLITNQVLLTNNFLPQGNFEAIPHFTKKIEKNNNSNNEYMVELQVKFIDEPENRFPINLTVKLSGIFEIKHDNDDELNTFLNTNAIQILYPYLRTMVSTITASALFPSINLPLIGPDAFKTE